MTPERLEVRNNGRELRVVWDGGRSDIMDAAMLRRECRSARARRQHIDGAPVGSSGVRITAVEPVGLYAVNIAFSDGEERGIYPFTFLADLARQAGPGAVGATADDDRGERA